MTSGSTREGHRTRANPVLDMGPGGPRRIVVFAPHFAEYATRLAEALSPQADVLLITERRNAKAECAGLSFGAGPSRVTQTTYTGADVLQRFSPKGTLERRRIRRTIEDFRPHLLHVQEQGDPFTASIVEAVRRICPVVLTVHDPTPHTGYDAVVAQYFARGLERVRAAADAYHVHGAYCEALLRRRLQTSKPILATAHGVILVPPDAAAAERGAGYLFFGRMEAYKGLETLLDAIDLLPAPGARFVLAGRGPELDRWRDRIVGNPAIELVEAFLPPMDAIRRFQAARAVIVPYRDATQSGVVSAAVGNGRPVIASAVGGLVDAVQHGRNGLLVPPGDPAALAAAIGDMAEESVCRRLTDGVHAAASDFAWDTIAPRLHALYATLISKAAAPR